jgi:hypothetical protein
LDTQQGIAAATMQTLYLVIESQKAKVAMPDWGATAGNINISVPYKVRYNPRSQGSSVVEQPIRNPNFAQRSKTNPNYL